MFNQNRQRQLLNFSLRYRSPAVHSCENLIAPRRRLTNSQNLQNRGLVRDCNNYIMARWVNVERQGQTPFNNMHEDNTKVQPVASQSISEIKCDRLKRLWTIAVITAPCLKLSKEHKSADVTSRATQQTNGTNTERSHIKKTQNKKK